MTGLEVKRILKQNNITVSKVARILGISPQLLHSNLDVQDIKTGVLERIAKAIGKDITFFFAKATDSKDIESIYEETKTLYVSMLEVSNSIKDSILSIKK